MRASLMRWHRRVGLAAALLVLLATVTGLLINHADGLGLAKRQVSAPWVLRWWGLEVPGLRFACEPAPGRWLSQWGSRLALDARFLPAPAVDAVVACAGGEGVSLVVDRRQLLVLQADGALVDQLPYPAGFIASRAARRPDGGVLIEGVGGARLLSDATASSLQASTGPSEVAWLASQDLPTALRERLQAAPAGAGLSAERVLLDVHSGRWLGPAGVLLMDAAAIALLLLAATGTWTVLQRLRGPRRGSAEDQP